MKMATMTASKRSLRVSLSENHPRQRLAEEVEETIISSSQSGEKNMAKMRMKIMKTNLGQKKTKIMKKARTKMLACQVYLIHLTKKIARRTKSAKRTRKKRKRKRKKRKSLLLQEVELRSFHRMSKKVSSLKKKRIFNPKMIHPQQMFSVL